MTDLKSYRGRPFPLGVSSSGDGLNFALLCRHGTKVWLVILPLEGSEEPIAEFSLHTRFNRTGDHWHIHLDGLVSHFRYGWRVDGPSENGNRYNPTKILLDPAATMLSNGAVWSGTCEIDPQRTSRRSVYYRQPRYDWGDDAPPLIPLEESVIYELHVRGFTCSPTSGVSKPGTFRGLQEKIPYLKWLGITAVELLPIHEFDECECPFVNPETGTRNRNFWGYNSIAFAALKSAYAATAGEYGQIAEFRDMVKAFHAAGIEVYLDVVFNHTGEGDDRGRTFSFRGLDNSIYYLMGPDGRYLNFTGCGNTMNCNHPVLRDLILTCLRFWVGAMHIDGLRFDLASILGRDQRGNVIAEPPVIEMIAEDGVLADTKLIAEPWDAAGLYQVGNFPFGRRWSEWNGRYRDDVRRFWKSDGNTVSGLATRIAGSADLYEWSDRLPRHSINFLTAHDGFTLYDLVAYNEKHNHANGEHGNDGANDNYSWNCGAEGETTDEKVNLLRVRRAKNMMATLMISQGVPMLLGGDEFLRTQKGNNNAWCMDNEISWVDWTLAEKNKEFLRFVREMIQLRKDHPALRRKRFFKGEFLKAPQKATPVPSSGPVRPDDVLTETNIPDWDKRFEGMADIRWHGVEPREPDWGENSHTLAFTLDGRFTGRETEPGYRPDQDFYVAMNAFWEPLPFHIPPSPSKRPWRRIVDTSLPSPHDIETGEGEPVGVGTRYLLSSYSMLILRSSREM